MALLSFVESAPRAYRLKASNAASPISTSSGTIPCNDHGTNYQIQPHFVSAGWQFGNVVRSFVHGQPRRYGPDAAGNHTRITNVGGLLLRPGPDQYFSKCGPAAVSVIWRESLGDDVEISSVWFLFFGSSRGVRRLVLSL